MERSAQHFLDLIRRSRRGKFKLYIGMIAGVGKTYRMLLDIRQLLDSGIDARIGYVETHGRKDTADMAAGLPEIPRLKVFYKGKELEEMDLNAILQSHPEVVVIDELAHSNIEGSKNPKRWQDVMDILDAGISVISAVNIQHIESLNQEVQDITGIEVSERVPDSVLVAADEVVNIDLTSDELIDRLKQGKIYSADKIDTALDNFFDPGHILQLRELALKEVALRVQKKIEAEMNRDSYLRHEHILACISSGEKGPQRIIRKVARLSTRLNAKFSVLYVKIPSENDDRIGLSDQRHLINNFNLATQLGGEVIQYEASNPVDGIMDICRKQPFSIVCIGRPGLHLRRFVSSSLRLHRLLSFLSESGSYLIIIA